MNAESDIRNLGSGLLFGHTWYECGQPYSKHVIDVKRCGDCPFVKVTTLSLKGRCNLGGEFCHWGVSLNAEPPTWCPLRTRDTIVRMG